MHYDENDDQFYCFSDTEGARLIVNGDSLTIKDVTLDDTGVYSCTVDSLTISMPQAKLDIQFTATG